MSISILLKCIHKVEKSLHSFIRSFIHLFIHSFIVMCGNVGRLNINDTSSLLHNSDPLARLQAVEPAAISSSRYDKHTR